MIDVSSAVMSLWIVTLGRVVIDLDVRAETEVLRSLTVRKVDPVPTSSQPLNFQNT